MLSVISVIFIQIQAAQNGTLIFFKRKGGASSWLKISYIVKPYLIREGEGDHVVVPNGVCDVKMTRKLRYWRD